MSKEKTIEELQILHSEMLATAADIGLVVPDELAVEFETKEAGDTTCGELDELIKKFRGEAKQSAGPEGETKTASKKSKRKKSKSTGDTAKSTEEKTDMSDTKTTTTAKKPAKKSKFGGKKTAKKAVAKKGGAKKAADGVKRTRTAYAENAKLTVVDRAAVDALVAKKTGWSERLKKVAAHHGKKIVDFTGSIADVSSAVKKGLVKVG